MDYSDHPMSSKTTVRIPPATEAWALMGELWQGQRGLLMAVAREFDLSPPQLFTLKHLDVEPSLPMGELAQHLHCDSSNVTGIVDRLEQRGLVERRAGAHDRRVKHLVLTGEGARVAEEIRQRMATPPPALQSLSAADQRALRDLLRRALS